MRDGRLALLGALTRFIFLLELILKLAVGWIDRNAACENINHRLDFDGRERAQTRIVNVVNGGGENLVLKFLERVGRGFRVRAPFNLQL